MKKKVRDECALRYSRAFLYRGWPFDFTFEYAMNIYRFIADKLHESKEKPLSKWDETIHGLAVVVMSERQHMRALEEYKRRLKTGGK